jgi:hypothetical protein
LVGPPSDLKSVGGFFYLSITKTMLDEKCGNGTLIGASANVIELPKELDITFAVYIIISTGRISQ